MKPICFWTVIVTMLAVSAPAQGPFGPPPELGPPPPAKTVAPFDPTGYWVALVTEDWRFRMVLPPKGDYPGVPLTAAARKIAEAWDPARDEATGEQCKAYGAPSIMRVSGRVHVTWQDDDALKVEIDAGTQTRLLNFRPGAPPAGAPTWQGYSVAFWDPLVGGGFGARRPGSLKVVTTRMRAGYLRKNGVPYTGNAVVTEYWDVMQDPNSNETWLLVKTIVEDPASLAEPFITSTHFRKQPDGTGFAPTTCSAR